jgi:uncharacterized protein YkwD
MMKRYVQAVMIFLVAAHLAVAEEAPLRTWRSQKGTTVTARYINSRGGLVVLEREEGGELKIPPSALCKEDRVYLAEIAAAEHEAALKRRNEILAGMGHQKPAAVSRADTPSYLSTLEWDVIKELNLARRDPPAYAAFLRELRKRHQGNGVFSTKRGNIQSKEGLVAIDEAIAFLAKAKPLSLLKPSKGLSLAADDHTKDTGPKGLIGHNGSDESTTVQRVNRRGRWRNSVGENIAYGLGDARAIVVQLIVDDGVASRGHRTNIYTGGFRVVGVATGPHTQYGSMCVMDFAGGFDD